MGFLKADQIYKYRAHPWHGIDLGKKAPMQVRCYIETVPTDRLKYELDKDSGILRIDRPLKYSNYCPTLYGLLPKTYCGRRVGEFCAKQSKFSKLDGDGDPLDICVLSEKPIIRGDILADVRPIGGLRVIDGDLADDKIIAVLVGDHVHGSCQDISQCSEHLIDCLIHYFLTYKDHPGKTEEKKINILGTYDCEEARKVICYAQEDYEEFYKDLQES